jgi:hypothetical protein
MFRKSCITLKVSFLSARLKFIVLPEFRYCIQDSKHISKRMHIGLLLFYYDSSEQVS